MNHTHDSNWVSMPKAFKLFWKNYVNFKGKSSRSEYWWWYLWDQIIHLPIYIILGIGITQEFQHLIDNTTPNVDTLAIMIIGLLLNAVLTLAIVIPSFSLLARRMRDAGTPNGIIITLIVVEYALAIASFSFHFLYILLLIVGIITFVITLLPSK